MTLREQAEKLNISMHTLKNWQNRRESEEQGSENLVSRANKLNSPRQILPKELLQKSSNATHLKSMADLLDSLDLSLEGRLLYFIIHFLSFKGILNHSEPSSSNSIETILKNSDTAELIAQELKLRMNKLNKNESTTDLPPFSDLAKLFKKSLNKEYDLPGLIYQSLREEGGRSRQGAWFTPRPVIDSMLRPYIRSKKSIFDPCCGSGLFLCRFAELKGGIQGISGMDLDPMAVFITRINLFLRFPAMKDLNVISQSNSLKAPSWNLSPHCLVATNPPWGAHLQQSEKEEMKKRYPEIHSGETASLFLRRCVEELPDGGAASFLLPDSLCYVQAHKDIRRYLLKNAPPVRINQRGRLFHSVYSEVFSCDILKGGKQRKVRISHYESHKLKRYKNNPDQIFNIHCSNQEDSLISKIKHSSIRSLPEGCSWLLGVVTGDNERFVTETPVKGCPPLLTGKEMKPFKADPPRCWLRVDKGPLQQSRKLEEYSQAKLIYRFIGYRVLFSIDREGLITLNSANSLVLPHSDSATSTGLEELAFWYNSSLFKFLWLKQYRSVKMLRRHLEELPIPLWNFDEKSQIKTLVQNAEKGQDISSFMDEMIFKYFKLTEEERNIVLS
jgi:N-6 DNA Methylase/TaqI-like C-terminal specificity domain